jgi:hypothetical protein
MLYLSIQPAEPYFLWQLEIQLQNFREIGINPIDVHIVLGYSLGNDRPNIFDHLEQENYGNFFYYPYDFSENHYLSSIRPVLLQRHFEKFPELYDETIFYHDSDIIFRERIDEMKFQTDKIWYLSDTRSYLSADYLLKFGDKFFADLCALVGISPMLVLNNNQHTGGAQYILKNVDVSFWNDVYVDGEKIFNFINNYNISALKNTKVQAWCADMWAILWNAWKRGIHTRLDQELDFCWPKEHISRWYSTKILHNSGVSYRDRREYFCKSLYMNRSPYYIDFSKIDPKSCSSIVVSKIRQLQKFQHAIELKDLTVIFHEKDLESRYLVNYLRYIFKNFKVKVILLKSAPSLCDYTHMLLEFADLQVVEVGNVSKVITEYVSTKIFLYIDARIFVLASGILKAYNYVAANQRSFARPYDRVDDFDKINREDFINLLEINISSSDGEGVKMKYSAECFMMTKALYVNCGGENLGWNYYLNNGFNLERESRIRILGHDIHFVDEPSYIKSLEKDDPRYSGKIVSNRIKYYERLKNGSKSKLLKDLRILNYSEEIKKANTSYSFGKDQISINIFNIERGSSSASDTLKEFTDRDEYKINLYTEYRINGNRQLWEILVVAIKKHDFLKQPFFIMSDEHMCFTKNYQKALLFEILKEISFFNLDYVNAGSTGGFRDVRRLSDHLIWVDKCLSIQMIILSKDFCSKILDCPFVEGKSIDEQLSELTELKCVTWPFLSMSKKTKLSKEDQSSSYPSEETIDFINAENYIEYELNHNSLRNRNTREF